MHQSMLFSSLLLGLVSTQTVALVEKTTATETQLKSWKLTENPLSLELIQRLPDQTRAFFQARGFSSKIANDIATQCVFQTIAKNTSSNPQTSSISYNLHDWKINVNAKLQGIKLKQQWNNVGEDEDTIFSFMGDYPIDFQVLLDLSGETIKKWPVKGLPTTFVVDPEGRLYYRAVGGREWDADNLLEQVVALNKNN